MGVSQPARVQAQFPPLSEPQPRLPAIWQIVWADAVAVDQLQALRARGVDGVFKCVAHAPNYPAPPILAGGEWRLVERVQGEYDWSSLRTCLDHARRANLWFIPELAINVPPTWFVDRYPDSLLRDSRGVTATDPDAEGAPYLLSPWFVASGAADPYLVPLVNAFLDVVSQYPNVPAVMIGNFKLNVLPWKMGLASADNFTFWPIWDRYARASFAARFGAGRQPPATWQDYVAMSAADQSIFRDWLTAAMRANLSQRYLPWLARFPGWKVVNASIWLDDDARAGVFTTTTPAMVAAKQAAIAASGVTPVVVEDDNMGDCGLQALQQQDVILAHGHGFLVYGERVPGTCAWDQLYALWQGLQPRPDGFVNIGDIEAHWLGRFRTMYGPPAAPPAACSTRACPARGEVGW